jgi:hypothetical protein
MAMGNELFKSVSWSLYFPPLKRFRNPDGTLTPVGKVLAHGSVGGLVALCIVPFIFLPWASVTYGQNRHSADECSSRETEGGGFEGSPDFYGLGIRIGVYLQWMSSLIANSWLPEDNLSMAEGYAGFSIAFFIAVLLLIFQDGCAYTVEMIILLNFLWGGTLLIFLPIISPGNINNRGPVPTTPEEEELAKKKQRKEDFNVWRGLKLAIYPLMTCLTPITTWFWIRLAAVGEVDFAATPGGTEFLLVTRIRLQDTPAAVNFLAFVCTWLICSPVIIIGFGVLLFVPGYEWVAIVAALLTPIGFSLLVFGILSIGILFVLIMVDIISNGSKVLEKNVLGNWGERKDLGAKLGEWCVFPCLFSTTLTDGNTFVGA